MAFLLYVRSQSLSGLGPPGPGRIKIFYRPCPFPFSFASFIVVVFSAYYNTLSGLKKRTCQAGPLSFL